MKFLTTAGLLLAVSGCAKTPMSTESSTSAIRGAEEAGAGDVPTAALHVQLAKESEAEAKALDESGDKEEAASLLLRSSADAELAVVLARAEAARIDAAEAQKRLDTLRSEGK